MAYMLWFGLPFLLSVWSTGIRSADLPDGVLDMKCHDRYFTMAVDLSFTGNELRFEAVDSEGVHPITEQYEALCGYSINILPVLAQAELRASYFSCHAEKDDETFVFEFNLIATHEGKEVTYTLNKTCSPSLPWSPREVSCEVNYMEISVRSDKTCPSRTQKDGWNAVLTAAYVSADSDWQVIFQKQGKQIPMTMAEARKQDYMFEVTDERLVFRAPYGQPHSFTTMVDGVSVEVVHATLFSRHSWVVLMVDLVVSCSMYEGSYKDGNVVWNTPLLLAPLGSGISGLKHQELSMWINGLLLNPTIVKERGYVVEETNTTFQISIPYNAKGGRRKSLVLDNKYHEYFVFYLYFEHLFEDEDYVETRLRLLRPLATPLLPQSAFSVDRTGLEEGIFTVYLGAFPAEVELVAVTLNEHPFTMPLHFISKDVFSNNTHGYTLRLPFEDSVVSRKLSKKGVLQYKLNINCSLIILPEKWPYYHQASVAALMTDIFPPVFEGFCEEQGISFKLEHQPFHSLWQAYIGLDPLTPELAVQKGYIMHNDSQALRLNVPLFCAGYTYKDVCLKKFSGSFEIIIRDAKTLEVQGSSVKTCPFPTRELVVCSTEGHMTVVVDLSMATPTGGNPSRSTLLDSKCGPTDVDGSRVLFSFALNSCGTSFKLDKGQGNAIYENKIVLDHKHLTVRLPVVARNATDKVTAQCVYPLSGLYRLFSLHKFESDFPGMGSVVHSTKNGTHPTDVVHNMGPRAFSPQQLVGHPAIPSSPTLRTKMSTTTPRGPINKLPASARYARRGRAVRTK